MSTSSSNPEKKYSFQWRNETGELDVFEAARYFNELERLPPYMNLVRSREQQQHINYLQSSRRSLDVPIMRSNPIPVPDLDPDYHQNHHHHIINQKVELKDDENKKLKQQPSSPGGRLASFLNSLFNQTSLNKKERRKKKKKKSSKSDFEEAESPRGRRKRRSSISSHFNKITNKTSASASADKGSAFPTPPPYAITRTKELPRFNAAASTKSFFIRQEQDEISCTDININGGKMMINDDDDVKFNDGGESDSSSDLFDLPNLHADLDLFGTSSLPLYQTTHMEMERILIN